MKKIQILVVAAACMFSVFTSAAQVVVKIRPVPPKAVVVRPVVRERGMVWIEPDWYWSPKLNRYVWRDGRWVRPRKHAIWVSGYWAEVSGGHVWHPGYWGRRK